VRENAFNYAIFHHPSSFSSPMVIVTHRLLGVKT
jgi:hypothetical protein